MLHHFRDRIDEPFVVARLVSLNRRSDGGEKVVRSTALREENFYARARGLGRLDEDELVFVRDDHQGAGRFGGKRARSKELLNACRKCRNRRMNRLVSRSPESWRDDFISKTVSFRPYPEDGG